MYELTDRGRGLMEATEKEVESWLTDYAYVPHTFRIGLGVLWSIDEDGEIPDGAEYYNRAWWLMANGYVREL